MLVDVNPTGAWVRIPGRETTNKLSVPVLSSDKLGGLSQEESP